MLWTFAPDSRTLRSKKKKTILFPSFGVADQDYDSNDDDDGIELDERLKTNDVRLTTGETEQHPEDGRSEADRTSAIDEVKRLLAEKNVLCTVEHPFITKMYCSFSTSVALHFVLEYFLSATFPHGVPSISSPDDRALLFRKICEEEPHFPPYFSPELCDLRSGLLHKEKSQRLGNGPNGMQDICDHPFFANLSRHRLETKRVTPPIIRKLASELDTSDFEDQFASQHVEGNLVYDEQEQKHRDCGKEENQLDFNGFNWCGDAYHFEA
ncbi:hypothetical protein PsorP6_002164 [Peronosclerospora sorghi]|uniref:Uncharacterized protein n=1 Tax=Peronosclerospora sorghi TaxID=230839 RepID=A0ACC0WTV2_9STRA|nr:hypothetical protein PsorP6_002164 [Peronosclerospora sorghi]